MNEKVVAVSGYFDPLHVGHIEYFELARALGDKLVVILNNDEQKINIKGKKPFMPEKERKRIIEALMAVDEVFISIDNDRGVCKSLRAVNPNIFANGGDRKKKGFIGDSTDIPELGVCKELGIELVDGLGAKIQSSSDLVKASEEEI